MNAPVQKTKLCPSCVLWTMVERKGKGARRLKLDICTYRKSNSFLYDYLLALNIDGIKKGTSPS